MESRKRPLADDGDSVVSKKRILTGANGSPHVNGVVDEEDEAFGEKLESYRKEAIYRRMKHYSREHERSQARIQELERRKSTCEAGLAAMSACWAQLVETIRLLVKTDDLPEVNIHAKEIFNLTAHMQNEPSPELSAALGDTVNATQALVTKFVQQSTLLQNETFPECQKAQDECVVLRAEIHFLRCKLEESESQKENYHNALIAAENRLERSRSATVREVETKGKDKKRKEAINEEKEEAQRKPSSPAPSPDPNTPVIQSNGFHDTTEAEILQEQLKTRDAKIVELEKEAALLRDEKTVIELEHKAPSFEQFSENPYYKVLLNHASYLESVISERNEQIHRLTDEVGSLQALRCEWEESAATSTNQGLQELRNMLVKRDAENARLREQREQQSAELVERRHRDQIKNASLQEYKSLVEGNSERINIFQSELSRCKAQLAANAGAEDLLSFFLGGNVDEVRFFENLKAEKTQAENRVAALEQTFAIYQDDHPDIVQHMKAQADALEQLSKVKPQLEKYQQTFGDLSLLPPDVSKLAAQLRSKQAEIEKLRLLERQRQEHEASLFTELEKLSTLWESLDRQLRSKVFDLSNMEDRLTKTGHEKAKSENKYYAAMREKEAIETERKNLARTVEKQGKVVDRLTDLEKQLRNQVAVLEKESVALKKAVDFHRDRVYRLEKENPELLAQLDGERKRLQELNALFQERENLLHGKKAELRAKEDEFIRSKNALEKQVAQLRRETRPETSLAKSDPRNHELENARAVVTCSTCRDQLRTTIITKCMHTFCRGCVDARLATRQRKCPACNLPFGQSDVHNFFWQ